MENKAVKEPHPSKESPIVLIVALEEFKKVMHSSLLIPPLHFVTQPYTALPQQLRQHWVAYKEEGWQETKHDYREQGSYAKPVMGISKVRIVSIVKRTPWTTRDVIHIANIMWYIQGYR